MMRGWDLKHLYVCFSAVAAKKKKERNKQMLHILTTEFTFLDWCSWSLLLSKDISMLQTKCLRDCQTVSEISLPPHLAVIGAGECCVPQLLLLTTKSDNHTHFKQQLARCVVVRELLFPVPVHSFFTQPFLSLQHRESLWGKTINASRPFLLQLTSWITSECGHSEQLQTF